MPPPPWSSSSSWWLHPQQNWIYLGVVGIPWWLHRTPQRGHRSIRSLFLPWSVVTCTSRSVAVSLVLRHNPPGSWGTTNGSLHCRPCGDIKIYHRWPPCTSHQSAAVFCYLIEAVPVTWFDWNTRITACNTIDSPRWWSMVMAMFLQITSTSKILWKYPPPLEINTID